MTTEYPQDADPTPDATPQRRRSRWRRGLRFRMTVTAASVLALAGIAGFAVWAANANTTPASTTAHVATAPNPGDTQSGTSSGGGAHGRFADPGWGYIDPGDGNTSTGSTTSTAAPAATATASESTGVVLIDTVLGYDGVSAAGTGIVLTSDGLVLTNNHVIDGSTQISVTVAATGRTYVATVVGTDAADDVALLRLDGASGLATATMDSGDDPAVGDTVTAVGNASGGGVLMAADGLVTHLDSSVTASTGYSAQGETLGGVIEFGANVVAGDSGGALLDKEGEVVGMTTAASVGSAATVGYAIPISHALAIVDEIKAGDESNGVSLGYPAFLGVAIASTGMPGMMPGLGASGVSTVAGALLANVYAATPAASAGLEAGDTITALGGVPVTSADGLSTAMSTHKPGDSVSVTWTDTSGATQTATVTLIEGPAA